MLPTVAEAFATAAAPRAALRAILADAPLAAAFRAHLTRVRALEPLNFFEAAAAYRAAPAPDRARHVYDTYVAPGAVDPVDVSGKARRAAARALDAGDVALFDACVESALANLARTQLKPFIVKNM